jgi:hypothetical protein
MLITEYLSLNADRTAWGWWWTLAGGSNPYTDEYAEYLGRWCLDFDPELSALDPHVVDQPYPTEQEAITAAHKALATYPVRR